MFSTSRAVRRFALGSAAVTAAMLAAPAAHAANIVLVPDSSFTSSPNGAAALLGFQKAANFWNTVLSSDVQVKLSIHFDALSPGVLGGAYSNTFESTTASVYDKLATTGTSALDALAVANLRPLSAAGGLAYRIPGTDPVTGQLTAAFAGSFLDNNDSYNNLVMNVNTSVNKALGLGVDYGSSLFAVYNSFNIPGFSFDETADGDITFSSEFAFDFDPTDGLDPGTYDFVGVAVHEIGHTLGFVSALDDYDFYTGQNDFGGANTLTRAEQDQFSWLSTLDLFRYGAVGVDATGDHFIQLDPNREAFFSLDGQTPYSYGGVNIGPSFFSTGRNSGDGQQGSHWKDSQFTIVDGNGCQQSIGETGVMDPTIGACALSRVTSSDLAAFDAMGWNIAGIDLLQNRQFTFDSAQIFSLAGLATAVPEPATWLMMMLGFGMVGGTMRRANRRVSVSYA